MASMGSLRKSVFIAIYTLWLTSCHKAFCTPSTSSVIIKDIFLKENMQTHVKCVGKCICVVLNYTLKLQGVKIPPENNCNDKHRQKRFAYESLGLFLFIFFFWGFRGDDNIQSMLVGAVLRKIKSRTWKKQRYFKLQDDGMTIWYKSKKAGNTHCTCKKKFTLRVHYPPRDAPIDAQIFLFFSLQVSVSDVETIREGHQSEVLLSIADEFPAERCFTLVFRGRRSNLDLVAESEEEAQTWIRGMRKLIENLENMGERERLDQYPFTHLISMCHATSR